MKIGIFDSGVGGLSILAAVRSKLPHEDYVYCCDNLNLPYGLKSEAEVNGLVLRATQKLYEMSSIDLLVVACNTATTMAIDLVRKVLPIPVVGVVPAIKPAALLSQTKVIGIIATPAAISHAYLDSLISQFAANCVVIKSGSHKLVQIAEKKLRGEIIDIEDIRAELTVIRDAVSLGLDHLVLGCTHFPLLAPEIRQVLPSSVRLIDSGEAIANRVDILSRSEELCHLRRVSDSQSEIIGFCSGPEFTVNLPAYLGINQKKLLLRTWS